MFVLVAVAASMVIGTVLWLVPSPGSGGFSFRDGLTLVPALSVIAAARGVSWRRKAIFFSLTLIGFIAGDFLFTQSSLLRLAYQQYSDANEPTMLVIAAYQTFVTLYPIVAVVLFVGSRPDVLWTRRSATIAPASTPHAP